MVKKANSQECLYFGRKLSNIICDDIEVSLGYVLIGSANDDEIYFDYDEKTKECKETNQTLKERVVITAMYDHEDGYCFDIDLEDVLRFAAKYCNGIYNRVGIEQEEYK